MIKLFRLIALMEGTSFLIILFITMPLKYIWQIPEPTYYVGMVHGLLFILYIIFAFLVYFQVKWKIQVLALVLLASLIPLGTFYIDSKYLKQTA